MEVQPQPATSHLAVAQATTLQPTVVAGFQVPENLKYHPGHTWAMNEGPKMVRIGLDDFAARLLGKVQSIMLPQRGQWVRQGQKIWTVERNGAKVDMVSPIEGVVTDVNDTAAKDPELARARSLRRRLAGERGISRRQAELPQPAEWRAGPLVDGRSRDPAA